MMQTLMMQPTTNRHIPVLLVMWLALVLIACNLGTSESAPPTLMPRASATPPATLGFNGQVPVNNVLPGAVGTSLPGVTVDLANLTRQVETDRLLAHVQNLQDYYTRHVNSAMNNPAFGIGAARNYIFEQFQNIQQTSSGRFTAILQEFDLNYNNVASRQANVVGVLQGTEPGAGFLIVGAHYDSINTDFSDAEGFAPGANDNASGVAALIELARILSQRQYRSSIIFVAFSAEEVGRLGSQAFVSWARERSIDIVGMINIDSIGNANDRNGVYEESLRIFSCEDEPICTDRGMSRQMARMAEFLGFVHDSELEMKVEQAADRDGRYGDHFSFAQAGYPAIRFISTLEEFGNGSQRDTIEFIEPDYFKKTTESIMRVIIALVDGPQPPRNITLRPGENGSSTLRWEPVSGAAGYVVALRWPDSPRYDQQLEWTDTSVTWDRFGSYAGIAIAAVGPNGLIGRLSPEYVLQAGR
jgi:bacterial leucyl aminopeptidase